MRILIAALAFLAGAFSLFCMLRILGEKRFLKTMDLILVIIFAILVSFTITMIIIFTRYGSIPDTLVTCVFAALAGECGIMGWIKTTKDRYRERDWEKEDREEFKQEKEDQ